jgi:hypothetical protein
MDHHKRFNKYCKQVFKELIVAYPESTTLKLVKAAFSVLKGTGKTLASSYFYKEVCLKHEQNILNGVPFFLDPAFSIVGFEGIGKNISEVWDLHPKEDHDQAWTYLITLHTLCKACYEK